MKRIWTATALLALLVAPIAAEASVKSWLLFGGANTDTTEQASPWIPVKGASRIVIRTWSTHSGTYTGVDSTRTDSLDTFKLLFSDSLTGSATDLWEQRTKVGADSIVVDAAVNAGADTARVGVMVSPNPITKQLRAPANGTGIVSIVFPVVKLGSGSTTFPAAEPVIPKQLMRVRCTPHTRLTPGGALSTAGIRTAGLKGLKMIADVYYDDSAGHRVLR